MDNNINESTLVSTYKTRSLQIAAFLFICEKEGVHLINFDKSDPRNIKFEFQPLEIAQKLEDDFILRRIKVYPKEYAEALNLLKEKVFQFQKAAQRV